MIIYFKVSQCKEQPDREETEKKMEILLELNLKQKTATRLGIVLVGSLIFALFCWNSALLSLTLGALLALLLRSPTNVYALVMTCRRDLM